MKDKNWKDMNGWEKAWEVTQITFGALVIALGFLGLGKGSRGGQRSRGGQGGSVWTVGSGGKKSGSWSSGRHR